MAITADDLLAPVGAITAELALGLRPTETDPLVILEEYADAANAKAAETTAAAALARPIALAWANARTRADRAQQILAQATSVASRGNSEGFSTSQAVELNKDSAAWLVQYDDAVAVAIAAEAPAPDPLGGYKVFRSFRYAGSS